MNRMMTRVSTLPLAIVCIIACAEVQATDTGERLQLTMEAQQVDSALNDLAQKLGVQIVLFSEDAAKMQAQPLNGNYTDHEALAVLLQGTGLHYEYINDRTIAVATPERLAEQGEKKHSIKARDKDQENIEEITITGSRISRTNYDAPAPMQVIDSQIIEQSGFNNISDIMLRTPVVSVGLGSANANYSNDAGATFIDLRGMGTDRTLVLINGRRRVSGSQSSSAVDLSTIPTSMIEGVEIVTGGASAVYGADAVTGAVNVKLKRDFEGLEINARTGMSQYGDAESYSIGVHGGALFADDRGSISFGVTRNNEEPLLAYQRGFGRDSTAWLPNPENTGLNDGIPDNIVVHNLRIPGTHYAGAFTIGDTVYTYDPGLRPIQNDAYYFGGALASGGDGFNPSDWVPFRIKRESNTAITYFNYELTEGVNFFTEINFANTHSLDPNKQPYWARGLILQRENPFIPEDVGELMDANGMTQLVVGKTFRDHGFQYSDIERNTYTIVSGLNGHFGDSWDWEMFHQYGRYDQKYRTANSRIESRFLEAMDVIADPVTGEPICRSEDARADGCAPLNIIGPNAASKEALAYLQHTRILDVKTDQQVVGAQLTGTLFSLPAGSLDIAMGAEYRKDSLSARDDGLAENGLLFFADNGGPPVDAEMDVYEMFAESLVPLVKDKPLIYELNIEAAARYSNYSTIGSTLTWKLGGDWAPTSRFRVRATRSKSVRAPNLAELFSPGVVQQVGVSDPCDARRINLEPNRVKNCAALGIPAGWEDPRISSRNGIFGGNTELTEETSESWTLGAVYSPDFTENFRVSIDYWSIRIEDAINSIGAGRIVEKCVDSASVNNVFCPLITRGDLNDPYSIDKIDIREVNIGYLTAKGIDVQAEYGFGADLLSGSWSGDMHVNLVVTYLDKLEELVDATDISSLLIKDGAVANPHWRGNLSLSYTNDHFGAHLNTRYVGSAEVNVQASPEAYGGISSRIYNDLYLSQSFGDDYDFSIGINNLLNVKPPENPSSAWGIGGSALHDNIGRYFFVGAKVRF